ncbi:Lrp/AsnC family transcriptional regulator [Gynuella sunshinyii]|uniref:Transcriptional regulator n=1 Tax=Gynuella sunshinyii YC6258 TaxID=1445510 RepID=A0A0C5VFL9_9GAMM|nr:Lrp/AsnC family transcriptional regulator [Gynuella sunshinyii]AJQ92981.1 transcriptional regulator [Gynuella sunshinyii YC6258]
MDKFDQLILQELIENARQPVARIAERVNLSRSSVAERIKKMEDTGIISGYQVVLKPPKDQQVSAFFEIYHSAIKCTDIIPLIKVFPEVVQCHGISGETDLLVLCRASSMERITEIRNAIEQRPQITKVKTHVVMTEWYKPGDW